jgi:hypothetical protein
MNGMTSHPTEYKWAFLEVIMVVGIPKIEDEET